ncbi:MAG: BRO-N domain-containing protein [Cetobacterium sp.]|uniref:BRO-N domain-containing protein n=1 Tax=Cetobacterium sp. TaxID=2071632 RepID=UPI003EE4C83E
MQNQTVRTFESSLFGAIHTFADDRGAPWFVGRQVAEKLGYDGGDSNISQALSKYCPDRKNLEKTFSDLLKVLPKGVRKNSVIISEADLYRLVMDSPLDEAEAFQDWVVREVLPSIRNHGGYSIEQPKMEDQYSNEELFKSVNEQFNHLNTHLNGLTGIVNGQTFLLKTIIDSLGEIKKSGEEAPKEDVIPEGYKRMGQLFAEQRLAFGSNAFNQNALKRVMDAVAWPTVRFNIFTSEGALVPVEFFKPKHTYRGQVLGLTEFLRVVIGESVVVGNNQRRHQLIGAYYLS